MGEPNIAVDDNHTGEEVLVAAQGPGAKRVHGFIANTDLFHLMMAAYGWEKPRKKKGSALSLIRTSPDENWKCSRVHEPDPHLIIPAGTQIVTRVEVIPSGGGTPLPRGTVGEVIKTPADATHAYRVRFPDGSDANIRRQEFSLLKHVKAGPVGNAGRARGGHDMYQFVIYRCIVGSQAYGLSQEHSDVDRRGIYLPPACLQWSLYGVPEQLEDPEHEEVYWELQKFLILALKANPNVLECLYTPLVETRTELAEELLAMRQVFLSRLVYQTYNGYVLSQFKKLEQDLRAAGRIKWKHAMHLIRLLLSGITVLREGFVPLSVEEHRDQLLAIRRGDLGWDEINAWRLELHRQFKDAYAATSLPEVPDYERVNRFLVAARRSVV